jgi:hypothetical protein
MSYAMAISPETRNLLRAATLDLALLRLDRTHHFAGEARTELLAILATDVAAIVGLLAVVTTLAAGGQVPVRWWVPGAPLLLSLAVTIDGVLGHRSVGDVDNTVLVGKALHARSDKAAFDTFHAEVSAASRRTLKVADRLQRRTALSIAFLLLSLLLALVPIGLDFPRVFPT